MMENTIRVNDAICIRCGRCVKVCPSQIFVQEKAGTAVTLHKPENCIVCGHCAAACPTGAVEHADFPAEKVHLIDYAALPTPEQVELLLAVRRSNRAFSRRPVPQEYLDRIVAAADRAPTATNARQLGYTLVTDPAMRREIVEYTLGVFGRILKRLSNPLVRPWLSRLLPGVYRYVPVFKKMRREYAEQGVDRILRGATAVLFIHAPKESRFGAEDANLAYQNASLTAESLGVSQVYMGFVLTAVRQDGKGGLNRMLGLRDRRICAVMALGMPQFRSPNYIDRKEPYHFRRLKVEDLSEEMSESGFDTKIYLTYTFEGNEKTIEAYGNGPIDAVQRGLQAELDMPIKVLDYTEHALQMGSNAQAAAYIHLMDESRGIVTHGVGISSNITRASIRALFSAVNRFIAKEAVKE